MTLCRITRIRLREKCCCEMLAYPTPFKNKHFCNDLRINQIEVYGTELIHTS